MKTDIREGKPIMAAKPGAIEGKGKWLALTAAILGWMFDGLEMGLFPLVARPAMQDLMGAEAASQFGPWMGKIIALFLFGAAFGGVLFGWLGDRIGRTKAMMWSVLAYSLFSGLCAFAIAPWQIGALRFLAALGMGGEWALGVALVMELFPSKNRPMMAGLIGAAANVGFLLIALISLGLGSIVAGLTGFFGAILPASMAEALLAHGAWRLLFLLGALPALLTFFIRVFVPESEKWHKSAAEGKQKVRIQEIFQGGLARFSLLGAGLAAVALIGTWASVQWIPSWGHKLSGGGKGVKEALQICSALGAIVFPVAMALVAQRLKRRAVYFGLCVASLIACAILFRLPMQYGGAMLAWTFLAGGVTAAFYGWLPLYLPELFPTRLRATASGFAFNAGRMIAAYCAIKSGDLVRFFNEDYARMGALMSLVYVVGLVLIWFGPETKDRPLPD
jgi:MFS transporter, SHS family, sialic acid transporter